MILACTASVISTNGTSRSKAISVSPLSAAARTSAPRQRPDVPAAQLDRQRAHPGPRQVGGVASQQRGLGGQRDPGGQHQLAALQQVRRVRQLEHVHPADPGSQAAGARDHLRAAPADHVEAEQVTNGGQHDSKRLHVKLVSKNLT